ncbi:MAG: hypothetical protein IT429_15790 [Gemmataceae bacterium]|nr:hypothetical protein [Gemmataceae bacterium]
MESEERRVGDERADRTAAQFTGEAVEEKVLAWEQVGAGRYMPRRIRGSFKGRALG